MLLNRDTESLSGLVVLMAMIMPLAEGGGPVLASGR